MSLLADVSASLSNGLVEAVAGGVSGGLTILCVLPIESIQTFQAAGNMPGKPSMGDVARHLWRQGGPSRFFKGWIASSSTVFTEKFWLFFWYSILQTVVANLRRLPNAAALGAITLTLCGWAAENLSIPTRYPVEVILRDQQTSLKTEGFAAVAGRIWSSQGLAGFYKGWNVYLLRPTFLLVLSPSRSADSFFVVQVPALRFPLWDTAGVSARPLPSRLLSEPQKKRLHPYM